MKQILFATTNATKAKRFSKGLLEKGIEVLCLRDLSLTSSVVEDGKDVMENARLKALDGFSKSHLPTIGMDDSLYLENVPDNLQPGLFVRRVNGKVLSDAEMIEHYVGLVKKYGTNGRLNSKWIYGLVCISQSGKVSEFSWVKDDFYMVDVPSKKIDAGYPLNSISKYKSDGLYFTERSVSDTDSEQAVVDFIASHIDK